MTTPETPGWHELHYELMGVTEPSRPPYPLGSAELRQHVRYMVELSQMTGMQRARVDSWNLWMRRWT